MSDFSPSELAIADQVERDFEALGVSTRALLTLVRSHGGAAPAFSPADIAGLRLWLDASDTSTITDAGGGAVSAWNDKSGNSFHVTQSTAGARPTTGVRTINGLNALDFGGGDYLRRGSTQIVDASTGQWTAFLVGIADSDAQMVFVDQTTSNVAQFIKTFGGVGAAAYNTAPAAFEDYAGGWAANSVPYVMTAQRSGAAVEAFEDGVGNGPTATTGTTAKAASVLAVGAIDGGTLSVDGAIAEVIIYNFALSLAQIAQVQDYLAAKWGISL